MKLAKSNFARIEPAGILRMLATVSVIAATGMAVGCAAYDQDQTVVGTIPDDYRTRHPIVVSQSEMSEDIVVSASASTIAYRDRATVENFAQRFKRSGSRSLAVLIPSGSPNEAAARRVAYGAVEILREKGISDNRISVQHYAAAEHGDAATVRLVYGDLTAHVPGSCGQWPADVLEDSDNRHYQNFGCATQHNLAAIIANPADLLGPRGESEIDATRRTTVIEDWRENGT